MRALSLMAPATALLIGTTTGSGFGSAIGLLPARRHLAASVGIILGGVSGRECERPHIFAELFYKKSKSYCLWNRAHPWGLT